MPVVERQGDGLHKLHPILDWDAERVQDYLRYHDLPAHPLVAEGYRSIGCEPCTKKPEAGGDARSGRWAGQAKTECGIHYVFEPVHAPSK
jgi:phosphoadenosine phosphosulfate reductase